MHSSFRLNGKSFNNSLELITYSENISEELSLFLSLWFDDYEILTVQTSGSTGSPKPIIIKKEFMKNSAQATGTFFNLKEGTKALCCLSVNYIAGKMMVIRALELGWDLDFIEPVSNPLEDAFETYDFCAMVPIQVKASLSNLNLVKKLLIGGGVVSQELQNDLQKLPTKCFSSYGMTETVTHIAIKKLNHFTLTSFDDLSITSNGVENIKHGKEKLVYTTLPNINISIDTRSCLVINAPLLSDELLITNDVVKIYAEDEFEWLGRYDNVINSGGVKLHPEQIEKELSKLIKQRFFVAGIPDEVLGEKLILIVEGNEMKLNLLSLKLSKFEFPKKIFFIEEFKETKTKKIQRKLTLKLIHKINTNEKHN